MIGLVVAITLVWGGWALAMWSGFHLQTLGITGTTHVSRAVVVAQAAIDRDVNVWLLDRRAIERRIEAIPYVATARLQLRPLASVWIDVVERTVEACVRDGTGNVATVDRDLRVVEAGCADGTPLAYDVRGSLDERPGIFLHDEELVRLQRDARALAASGDRFRRVGHDELGAFEGTLHDGIRVRFGDDADLDVKQRLIGPILAQLGARAASVRAVDLRALATPVVEYRR